MKKLTLLSIFAMGILFSGCANNQPEPVAMNMYNPDEPVVESSSSASVEVTKEMIENLKKRHLIKN